MKVVFNDYLDEGLFGEFLDNFAVSKCKVNGFFEFERWYLVSTYTEFINKFSFTSIIYQ